MYSVVIATLPGEPMLPDALASIMAQTLSPTEILVVCDRGRSERDEWTKALIESFPSVLLLEQAGVGMASAIAHGISRASQPFVSFLDSDDLWTSDKQRHQVELLLERTTVDVAGCQAINQWSHESPEPRTSRPQTSLTFTASTFRASTFRRIGLPDPQATHHTWLYRWWAKARSAGIEAVAVPYVGLIRRIHDRNSWRTQGVQAHQELLREVRRICANKRGIS